MEYLDDTPDLLHYVCLIVLRSVYHSTQLVVSQISLPCFPKRKEKPREIKTQVYKEKRGGSRQYYGKEMGRE